MANSVTTIAAGTLVEGRLEGDEDLRIEGRLEGTIALSETLTIAEGGFVRGEVEARVTVVEGFVDGTLRGESVILGPTAQVRGTIATPALVIEDGARFAGDVEMEVEGGAEAPARPARAATPTRTTTTTSARRSAPTRPASRPTPAKASPAAGSTGTAAPAAAAPATTTTTTVVEEAPAEEPEAAADSGDAFDDLTVKELRERLRDLDLPVSGTKDELVDRLRDAES